MSISPNNRGGTTILSVGRIFRNTLGKNFENSVYIYPCQKPSKDILILTINKIDQGVLTLKYSAGKDNYVEHTISTSHRKFLLYEYMLKKNCDPELNTCPLNIFISTSREFKNEFEGLEFEIAILQYNNNSNPTFIKPGSIRFDGVFPYQFTAQAAKNIKYQYYYTGIEKDQSCEIVIDFKRGNGIAVAKIVTFDEKDLRPEFDERVEMPKEGAVDLLKFDYFNKKFVISDEQTQKCVPGCEIFIGVYSVEESMYFNLNEYSILVRYDDTIVSLPVNEYVFGSLSRTEMEDEYDYFSTSIHKDTDRVIFDFNSELCAGYIKLGPLRPSKDDFDWYFDNSSTFFTIFESDKKLKGNKLQGQIFTVAISTKTLDGSYSSFYRYKVITPDRAMPTIIEVTTGHNELCSIDEDSDRCYFNIPVFSYDYLNSMYVYALNNDKNDADIEIYTRTIEMEKYEKMTPDEIKNVLPSESNNDKSSSAQFNKNLLYLSFDDNSIDKIIFVTVKSSHPGLVTFLSTFHSAPLRTSLHPNSYEMYYVSGGYNVSFNILGKNTYYIETVRVKGEGSVSNSKNGIETRLSSAYRDSQAMIIRPSNETVRLNVRGEVEKEDFVFYVYYKARSEEGNFDLLRYNTVNHVEYISTFFPLSYYIPVEDESNDVSINVRFSLIEYGKEDIGMGHLYDIDDFGDEQFDITGVVTNEVFIIERKKNKEASPEAGAIATLSYDPSLRLATIFFKKEDIINYTSSGKKYFYIALSPSRTNRHIYTKIACDVVAFPYANVRIPRNEYYYTRIKGGNMMLRLDKGDERDRYMDVEFAFGTEDVYSIAFNDNVNSEIKSENGKNKMRIDMSSSNSVIVNIKIKNETNIKDSAFVIKYDSYEEQSENNLYLPSNDIEFKKENGKFLASFKSIRFANGSLPINSTYSMRVYERAKISNDTNLNCIYPGVIPDRVYTVQSSEDEVTFEIKNYPEGEHYVNFIVSATGEKGNEFLSYETVNDFEDRRGNGGVLIFCLVIGLLLLVILALGIYRKVVHARYKSREEAFEYEQLSETQRMKNKNNK